MGSKSSDRRPAIETDPRFPSGPWVGFWIQDVMGKQMMSLSLAFFDGRVTGTGRDIVGRFDFLGRYELKTGRVRMTKQYQDAHQILYEGANQNDGQWLWGIWTIPHLARGGFHIWPEGEDDPTQKHLRTEKELPKPKRSLKKGELLPL
jgi:hypothetical protein